MLINYFMELGGLTIDDSEMEKALVNATITAADAVFNKLLECAPITVVENLLTLAEGDWENADKRPLGLTGRNLLFLKIKLSIRRDLLTSIPKEI